jgi:hypothetical protein
VPRGDPVNGIGSVRDGDAVWGQLLPESYRPRTGGRGGGRQGGDPLRQLLGAADEWVPEPLSRLRVERREDLAAAGIEDDQARLGHSPRDRVERADARRRRLEAGGEAAGGGDADPQAGEGTGADPDRDQVDRRPAAGRLGGALDLAEQRRGMPRTAARREAQQRLVQSLAVAPGAGGGVGGGGVEADDYQGGAASSP